MTYETFVDRFTNEKCVKAFDHVGVIREVALYAAELPKDDRKDPIKHVCVLILINCSQTKLIAIILCDFLLDQFSSDAFDFSSSKTG